MKVVFVALSEPYSPYSPPVAALSAAVRAVGHETAFLGFPLATSVRDAAEAIAAADADVVATTMMSRDWPGVRSLLPKVKASSRAFTVVGGYHATLAPRQVADCAAIDAICIGEGEIALPALLDRLAAGHAASTSPGMWVRGPLGFVDPVPPGAPGQDIAALPRWDYDVLGGVDALLAHGVNIFGDRRDRFLPIRGSRGCPYKCTFCSAPRWGSTAGYDASGVRNVKPVELLSEELAELRDRHHPDGFEFWDEHFPLDTDWLEELAREYPRRVGLPFRAEMHPNAASRERLELLARAGCVLFHCGVESGDAAFRRNVLKRHSTDALLVRVFDDARALGMATSASVMMGCPGETVANIESTLTLLRRLQPDHVFCSKYQPLPGTALGDGATPGPAVDVESFDAYRRDPLAIDPRCLPGDSEPELFARFEALRQELAARSADMAPSVARR
jgi:anaerobic magnesium-protoporphyrin IX monomethyl ester cyclase